LFGERTQEGGPKILCGIVTEDSRLYSACIASLLQKTTQQRIIIAFSECFPDVCPEPVLAKRSFFSTKWRFRKKGRKAVSAPPTQHCS